ncbi:MAG TPA: bifunctional serine/threonine-protein kinase/formylglycine-generating enzyme family protein [Planctomycetota bacterium]
MSSSGIPPGVDRLFQEYLESHEAGLHPEAEDFAARLAGEWDRGQFLALARSYEIVRANLPVPAEEPDRIGGYRLGEVIGRGGMCVIYASRTADGVPVALKVLHEDLLLHPAATRRFAREIDNLEHLDHPHVVKVLGHGQDGERLYLVMERMCGGTLRHRIEAVRETGVEPGAADVARSLWIAECIAEALAAAHRQHVVHRDVKPSNILFGGDGEPRLADFGLARVTDATRITGTDQVLGTAPYVAPERLTRQGRVADDDPRIDVYSLGVTLFEMLTGFPPYQGQLAANQAARQHGPPPMTALPAAAREPALEAILERCLEPDPKRRYASARELADDLAARREGRSVRALRGRRRRQAQLAVRNQPLPFAAALLLLLLTLGLGGSEVASRKRAHARASELLAAAAAQATEFRLRAASLVLDAEHGSRRATSDWSDPSRRSSDAEQTEFAARTRAAALAAFEQAQDSLLQALGGPRDSEVRAALGALWLDRYGLALREGRIREMAEAAEHAAEFGAPLRTGTLELSTDPPDATVWILRFERGSELPWKLEALPGATGLRAPVQRTDLAPGSYLLEMRRSGQERTVRLPFVMYPGENLRIRDLWLPSDEQIGDGWEYVPPGRFLAGGDPLAQDPELATLRYIEEGFFIQREELRFAEYKTFLVDLGTHGNVCCADPDAARTARKDLHPDTPVHFVHDRSDDDWDPESDYVGPVDDYFHVAAAVHSIAPVDAQHYLIWRNLRAREAGQPGDFALPTGDQWEFAARGADGRHFSWGNDFDWRCTAGGRSPGIKEATMRPGLYPDDRSPFGLLDVCGNVRELCLDREPSTDRYLVRGGEQSYYNAAWFRLAGRSGALLGEWNWNFGMRLVRRAHYAETGGD